jgi:hypothetical protein
VTVCCCMHCQRTRSGVAAVEATQQNQHHGLNRRYLAAARASVSDSYAPETSGPGHLLGSVALLGRGL